MKYRIVKHYFKDKDETLCHHFLIGELEHHKGIFKNWETWEVLQKYHYVGGITFAEDITFKTEKDARKHVKKLLTPIPPDEIISPNTK
jgi:hypothetical protein